jgi:hypothetical protein
MDFAADYASRLGGPQGLQLMMFHSPRETDLEGF